MAADALPRKVVVGTMMQSFWEEYPGLEARLETLGGIVDEMAERAQARCGRGLDLAVLTEYALTGETRDLAARAVSLKSGAMQVMGEAARRHGAYLIVGTVLKEESGGFSNAAVLLDREGRVAGVYRKVHAVADKEGDTCEGGVTPGRELPVFACDFGRLAIAICFDMNFDEVWEVYGRKGAEIVAWPTQSPQTVLPRCRARTYGYYLVSSTWRDNASVFDPTGDIVAQITEPERVLATEVDLTYVLLGWQPKLEGGQLLRDRYREAVGYRYRESEDIGIFWSNDPARPIMQMVRESGLELWSDCLARSRATQDRVRGGPPPRE